jgi:hypothetical protein
VSADPRTDFFASGAGAVPAADQDARTAFFASGGQADAPTPTTTYDAKEF